MKSRLPIKLDPPLKWHGGKHYLAKWIIEHFPKHTHYVEPYFGGGSVLLSKPHEGVSEVINDIDKELSNFWYVLRRQEYFEQLKLLCEKTPFSENEFNDAMLEDQWIPPDDKKYGNRVVSAWQFFIRARQSRQGLMKDFATLSRTRTRRGMNEQVSSWLTAIEGLPAVHDRLKRVVVLNRDALSVIRSQDDKQTLFYLDPPYMHETRVTTCDYAHEMTRQQHVDLLTALEDVEGKFVLSGYPSKLYNKAAKRNGWHVDQKKIDNKASSKKVKELKTECLWMNFDWRKL